jgi:hypothetical protein
MVGDSEGLVNYGLSIEGVRLSVLIVDRTVARKMSFRAKGDFPANEFARILQRRWPFQCRWRRKPRPFRISRGEI